LDVFPSVGTLNGTLAITPPLEGAIKQISHRLSVLTGRQPSALTAELAESKPLPAFPALVSIGKPEDLLRRRPDIRAAERPLAPPQRASASPRQTCSRG